MLKCPGDPAEVGYDSTAAPGRAPPPQEDTVSVRTTDRRRNARVAAAHPVAIRDRRGRILLRGRTSDLSESGLFCLTEARRGLRLRGKVILEVTLPAGRPGRLRHSPTRTVRYAGRITRTEEIGQAVGMAIELLERLS